MKKQITFEIGEKPSFENEVEIKQELQFLMKLEQAVKLYNKHQKALKDYMVKNNKTDISVDGYNAHISTGTARMTLDSEILEIFLNKYNKTVDDFKTLGNPPKSLELYRD